MSKEKERHEVLTRLLIRLIKLQHDFSDEETDFRTLIGLVSEERWQVHENSIGGAPCLRNI